MQARVCEDLAGRFPRVDQVIYVIAFNVVQSILHENERDNVEKYWSNVSASLAQVVGSEAVKSIVEEVADSEDAGTSH